MSTGAAELVTEKRISGDAKISTVGCISANG